MQRNEIEVTKKDEYSGKNIQEIKKKKCPIRKNTDKKYYGHIYNEYQRIDKTVSKETFCDCIGKLCGAWDEHNVNSFCKLMQKL